MRLSEKERFVITNAIGKVDPIATIYLFGSRVDDTKLGGDIDLLVVTDSITIKEKIDILMEIKEKIGDQKIDIYLIKNSAFNSDPFVNSIQDKIKKLSA